MDSLDSTRLLSAMLHTAKILNSYPKADNSMQQRLFYVSDTLVIAVPFLVALIWFALSSNSWFSLFVLPEAPLLAFALFFSCLRIQVLSRTSQPDKYTAEECSAGINTYMAASLIAFVLFVFSFGMNNGLLAWQPAEEVFALANGAMLAVSSICFTLTICRG
ncbi:hypothetical protein [Vreelandella neptunia]|uniref:Uncharacterized protein n=1 Tax=Vreelandella neptunia TaxID=115551 RepID=A0ABS9S3Z9_9GAMM|nr:hypothetical protein [Halomonas neptunia]MCH4810805.1 hypothetical protein [Halomonas neptunia]